MIKKVIDGKKIIVKGNSKNIPSFKTIKEVYAKIPDNKRIPVVFETKEQYLDEYIKNQEKSKKTQFKPSQIAAYKHSELANMSNIVSRYTTNHNPFIDRRVVFFNDHKIPVKQFHDSALHEYGHELWEKNPKIRKDWRSVSNSTSPTPYGRTAKQEDFAESYMLHKTGRLADPRRERIISDDVGVNRIIHPWHGNIEQQSINNPNYRKVIETGKRAQLVLMSLKPKEEIGNEVHPKVDQFFRIEQGRAKFTLANGKINYNEGNGGAVFVPAGTWHNVTNTSAKKPLKLYTIYSPPNHKPGTIQHDRPSKDLSVTSRLLDTAREKWEKKGITKSSIRTPKDLNTIVPPPHTSGNVNNFVSEMLAFRKTNPDEERFIEKMAPLMGEVPPSSVLTVMSNTRALAKQKFRQPREVENTTNFLDMPNATHTIAGTFNIPLREGAEIIKKSLPIDTRTQIIKGGILFGKFNLDDDYDDDLDKDNTSKDSQIYLPQTQEQRFGNRPLLDKRAEIQDKQYDTYLDTFSELGGGGGPNRINITGDLMPIQAQPYEPIGKDAVTRLKIRRTDTPEIVQAKEAAWTKVATRQKDVSNQDISAISQTLGDIELQKYLYKGSKATVPKGKRLPKTASTKLAKITAPTQAFTYTDLTGEHTVMIPPRSLTSAKQREATEKDIAEGKGYRDYTRRDWVPIDDTKPLPTVGQLIRHPLDSGDLIFNALDFNKTKRAAQDWSKAAKYNLGQAGNWLDRTLTHAPIHTIRTDKPESRFKPATQPSIPLGYKLFQQFNTQDSRQSVLNDPRQTDEYGNARPGFAHVDLIGRGNQLGGTPRIAQDTTAKNSVRDELGAGTGKEGMPYLKFNPPRGSEYPAEYEFSEQFKEYGLQKYFDPRGEITELGSKVFGATKDKAITSPNIVELASNDIKVPSFKEAYSVLGNKALFTLNPSVSPDRIHALANDVSGVPSFTTMLAEAGTRPGINTTHWTKDPTILSKDTTANNRKIAIYPDIPIIPFPTIGEMMMKDSTGNNRIIRDDDSTNKLVLKFDGNDAQITNTGDTIVTRNEAKEIVTEMVNRRIKGHTEEDKEVKRELGTEMMEDLWPQVDADNQIIEGHKKFPKTYPTKDVSSKDFSLLDAEFIERVAPEQGAIPTEFKWVN